MYALYSLLHDCGSHLPLSCPASTRASQPEQCIWNLYLIISPRWGFSVTGCSFLHVVHVCIELNSRQVRRIPQISYRALASQAMKYTRWPLYRCTCTILYNPIQLLCHELYIYKFIISLLLLVKLSER